MEGINRDYATNEIVMNAVRSVFQTYVESLRIVVLLMKTLKQ